jgi:hypothetical protein
MFDDPSEPPPELAATAQARAAEKIDEFRLQAELCAVFEATWKYDAQILPVDDPKTLRSIQKTIAGLERDRIDGTPVIKPERAADAAALLDTPRTGVFSTNDYHVLQAGGQVLICRWLEAEQVQTFYERFQAHFDVALHAHIEEFRSEHEWRQDPGADGYLRALESSKTLMAQRYLRDTIREHRVFVLSTHSVGELNLLFLCEQIMRADPAEVVGADDAPDDTATDADRTWYFKLFALRGVVEQTERMFFFAFMEKASAEW